MNIQFEVNLFVRKTVLKLKNEGKLPAGQWSDNIKTEIPADRSFGDFATNVAMVIAREFRMNPRVIATTIVECLEKYSQVSQVSIAGPGFINIKLADFMWEKSLKAAISEGHHYGDSDIGQNEKINVEFLSANPTGPLHVGHTRGAIYGDVLSRLLKKIGYDVTTEYYINDYGNQIEILEKSVFWRYEELFGLHKEERIPEGQYPGNYLIPVAEKLKARDGDKWLHAPQSERESYFKSFAVDAMMELIKSNLKDLGIVFDVYTSEKSLVESKKVDAILSLMKDKGLLYQGVLVKPQGESEEDDWDAKPQLLFKATEFGDDSDRVIARSDGTTTYFASDIAYHYNKFQRGFNKQIDIWGADHGGYVKRMKSAVKAVTDGAVNLETNLCQIVNLEKDGKPFKMSKRAGNFVLSSDILQEINADAFRLFMLTKSANSQMTFDLSKAKERTKDNPVFYIQYAFARSNSVITSYENTFDCPVEQIDISEISFMDNANEMERSIIHTIAAYPSIVEIAGLFRAPNLIVSYLEDLAREFHSLWTNGTKLGLRFIDKDNRQLTERNMLLIRAVQNTLENGLLSLGITPQKKMEYQL